MATGQDGASAPNLMPTDQPRFRQSASLGVKNDNKLRALAIKKKQIHVVGDPSIKPDGIPIFLDVEGMPDREFYYLVGLRFESAGKHIEHSFWADGPAGEQRMWEKCLQTLMAIGSVQFVSYGAYEVRFLRRMRERYVLPPSGAQFVNRMIETSLNLVGCISQKSISPRIPIT